jgi:nitrogen fixation NifU-like protein
MSDASAELFQAVIDEHRRRPRNRGPLPSSHRVAKRENPVCGDLCTIQLRLDPAPVPVTTSPSSPDQAALPPDTRIAAAAFTGAGCALSQASASLATVALFGRTVAEARALASEVEQLVRSGAPLSSSDAPLPVSRALPPDLAALAAVHAFPARHACALLVWRATLDALAPEP